MEKDAEGFYTPAPDSKPEAPSEQEDSAYLNSVGGLGSQLQIPARRCADQTQINDLETDLIKSTFDVTVRRARLLCLRAIPDGERMPEPVFLPFRLRLETNNWIQTRRCIVSRRSRNSDCSSPPPVPLMRLMVDRHPNSRL